MVGKTQVMLVVLSGVALAGCLGDSGGGGQACSEIAACGGDPSGRWEIVDSCVTGFDLGMGFDEPECKNAIRGADVELSGTYELNDGVAVTQITTEMAMDVLINQACVDAIAGAPVSINAFCPALESEYESNPLFDSVACSVVSGGCACDLTSSETSVETRSFTIHDNSLDDGTEAVPFCVDGDTLRLQSPSPQGEERAVITLQRIQG